MDDVNRVDRDAKAKKKEEESRKRIASMIVMTGILVTVWYMLDLVLLTFVLCFIFYNLLSKINMITGRSFKKMIPDSVLLLTMYVLFVGALSFISGYFAPRLAAQIAEIAEIIRTFDFESFTESSELPFAELLLSVDLTQYTSELGSILMRSLSTFGAFGINLFLALMLSLFLLLEKDKIKSFGEALSVSKVSFFYEYFMRFGVSFTHSFGTVMKVQVTIAFINCILSMIMLVFLGLPQVLGLGIMIFFLGLVPVAGVIISLVPLSIVAFSTGGLTKVIAIIIMIIGIHAIEAYILNPKLMSDKMSLPISMVFIILLVAEHYLKVWGLLIGVPIFIFVLNYFEVEYSKVFTHKKPNFDGMIFKDKKKPKHARGGRQETPTNQRGSRSRQESGSYRSAENRPPQEGRQPPLGDRQIPENRQEPGSRRSAENRPQQEGRQPPLGNRQMPEDRQEQGGQRSTENRPPQERRQPPLGNRQMPEDRQT